MARARNSPEMSQTEEPRLGRAAYARCGACSLLESRGDQRALERAAFKRERDADKAHHNREQEQGLHGPESQVYWLREAENDPLGPKLQSFET